MERHLTKAKGGGIGLTLFLCPSSKNPSAATDLRGSVISILRGFTMLFIRILFWPSLDGNKLQLTAYHFS